MEVYRQQIKINGIVQGVGFRPFIYRIARKNNLTGFVQNSSDGVIIESEGTHKSQSEFYNAIISQTPPLAKIVQIKKTGIALSGDTEFRIISNENTQKAVTFISPDLSICDDCLAELFDPQNRRYKYPFINCTNCGPRYTIVESIPYDRLFTSMRDFHMCPSCQNEYDDPEDRRFHAQPNACPDCGPQIFLYTADKKKIETDDPLRETVNLLKKGKIVAIRGLGGFHLAVDPFNDKAVLELRKRKGRQGKPFALMAANLNSLKKFCVVSDSEHRLLSHYTHPIVLLTARQGAALSKNIAPENNDLGVMLPYSPLHHILMHNNFDALVMTSANFTDEPIAIKNAEAMERLSLIADYFLMHNREILQRCDDSIVRFSRGRSRLVRRSRGFVPGPVFLEKPTLVPILACGAELKNTVAVSRGNNVFLSQHIGDLDNPAALDFFEQSIKHLTGILQIQPQVIVCDMHPEYLSTKWAKKQDLPIIEIQHHHAHLAAVMAENKVSDPVIGLILDGTGYGNDGTIWGGEVLIGDFHTFERFSWLKPVHMPGASAAIKQPWRMAISYLDDIYKQDLNTLDLLLLKKISSKDIKIIQTMIGKHVNSPLTSGCGRLFDAVSAILGICYDASFEAEAAIKLEMIIDKNNQSVYSKCLELMPVDKGALEISFLVKAVTEDILSGTKKAVISAKFHNTLAEIFVRMAEQAREKTGINRVGLSGGVYQNKYFFNTVYAKLNRRNFNILTHSEVPANDGGIALGQIAVANAKMIKENMLS